MLMIAAREGPGLPEGVSNWIRQWLGNKAYQPRPRALVALLEPDKKQGGASNGVLAELKQLAALGAVDFIANGDEVEVGARANIGGRGSQRVRQFLSFRKQMRHKDCGAEERGAAQEGGLRKSGNVST
jgi:hypothetical protein